MSGLTNADADVVQGLLLEWETRLHSGRPVSPEELCRDRPELLCSLRQQVRLLELMGASEDGFASTNSPVSEFVESQEPAGVGELTSAKGDFAGVRFAPLRFHARGGLGEVWQAQDLELGREVALKTIPAHRRGDPDSRTRFFREAEITGRLDHPGVVPVFGMGVGPTGAPYYAMRFVRGETLTAAIETFHAGRCQGPREVAFRRLLGRFVAVCQTVAYAHSRGVIHRDLKPDNILLGPFGETLVVDWGLAKQVCADGGSTPVDWPARGLPPAKPGEFSEVATMVTGGGQSPTVSGPTTVGTVVGTPGYMSPEQASGLPVGPATDLYALGVTLAVLLVGQIPTEVLSTLRRGKTAAKAPPALWAVARKACAPRPTDRYPDASALAAEVERWLADEPVSAWREPFAARAARWMRRHRTLVTSVAVLLCSMSVALSVGLVAVRREQSRTYDEWQRAEENAATAHAAADISALNARRARAAEALAERRAELARTQYGLAVGALESLVTNVQDRLAKTPGTRSLQEDILADALVRLYQLAEETHRLGDQQTATTSDGAVADRTTVRGHLRLGGLFLRMGSVRLSDGVDPLEAAEKQFERAQEFARSRWDAPGASLQDWRDWAEACAGLGRVALSRGQPSVAAQWFNRISEQTPPGAEGSWVDELRGDAAQLAGDWPKARQCFERAIHTAASQTHRADRLDKLGHVHWSTGAVAEARACYQEALMLRLAAVAQRTQTGQPIPIGLSRSVAIGEMNLGDVEFAAGAYKPAEALWESARQRWEATVLADPSDLRARWEYAVCLDRLGRVGLAIAKPDLTCRYGNEALSLVQQVRQCDPQDRLARRQEAVIRENLSQAHWRLGRGDMARALRTEVIGLRQSLAAEAPDDVTATFELYTAWRNLGVLELDDYRPAQASKALRAAAEHLQTLAQKQGDSQPRGWAEQLDDLRADLTLCGHAERACRDLEFALAQGEHTGWFVTVRVRAQTRADDYAAALETIGTMIERCRDANAVWDAVVLYASVAVDAHRRDPPAADKALSKLADAVGLLLFVQ